MTALPAVQKALIAGDHVGVLRGLLDAWCLNRAPEVADMIAHVGLALESAIAPLGVTGPKQAYQAWLSRAARGAVADLTMLLRDLFDGPPAHIRRRLGALDAYDPDPRIAVCLVEYLGGSGDWLPNTPVGTAIFKALARHGDARALRTLRDSAFAAPAADDRAWRTRKLATLATVIDQHQVTALDRAARDVLARVAAIAAGPTAGETNLTAAARDQSARMVATDQLLEEGGPRGEFVILQQLKRLRALTTTERRREHVLLVAHRKKWMGGVAKILDPAEAVFEDGVLVGGKVECGMDELAKVIEAPEWSTVRFVDFAPWTPDLALLWRWPTITTASVSGVDQLVALANATPALALTELRYSGPEQRPTAAERDALVVARGLPALEHLSISGYWHPPSALAWLFEGALARRLRRFDYTERLAVAEFVKLLARAPANLEIGTLASPAAGARIDFTRDARRRFSRAVVGFTTPKADVRRQFDKLVEALAVTPNGLLTSVAIDPHLAAPTKAHRARLDAVVTAMV